MKTNMKSLENLRIGLKENESVSDSELMFIEKAVFAEDLVNSLTYVHQRQLFTVIHPSYRQKVTYHLSPGILNTVTYMLAIIDPEIDKIFRTLKEANALNRHKFMKYAKDMSRKYAEEDFEPRKFLYFCVHVTKLAMIFYSEGVREAHNFAFQAVLHGLQASDFDEIGWESFKSRAENYNPSVEAIANRSCVTAVCDVIPMLDNIERQQVTSDEASSSDERTSSSSENGGEERTSSSSENGEESTSSSSENGEESTSSSSENGEESTSSSSENGGKERTPSPSQKGGEDRTSEKEEDRTSENEEDRTSENEEERTSENEEDRTLSCSENEKDRTLSCSENEEDRILQCSENGEGRTSSCLENKEVCNSPNNPVPCDPSTAGEAANTNFLPFAKVASKLDKKYLSVLPSEYQRLHESPDSENES